MEPMRRYIDIIREAEVLDRERTAQQVPLQIPGGVTVVVLNDPVTPFEVAVEAVAAATRLSPEESARRMMAAHRGGWAAVAAYANRDVAETVADRIMQHARANDRYDQYRQYVRHQGPWPLTAEVMDAEQ